MAGLDGYTKERIDDTVAALGRERAGYELKLRIADEEKDEAGQARYKRLIGEVDDQIKVYKAARKGAPEEGPEE